jgi:hypothetical protein
MAAVTQLQKLVPLRTVAVVLNRDTRTVKRWIKSGLLPAPLKRDGQNLFTETQVESFRLAAEQSGLLHHQRRAEEFQAILNHEAVPTPTVTSTPWKEIEPEARVKSWAEMTSETPSKLSELPVTCTTCWRSLVQHGVTDPQGRRWLLASCELHGEQGRQLWM